MIRDATDPAEVRHLSYETLGSTNAEALALARAGERGPVWITARTQSAGRGRRTRRLTQSRHFEGSPRQMIRPVQECARRTA